MALQIGSPVVLFQITVVSLWFVIPTESISEGETELFTKDCETLKFGIQ